MIDHLFSREPWPHQREGVQNTIESLSNGTQSVCLTAPTGSGKTAMQIALAKHWAEELGCRVLCLTNRILLTRQTRSVFEKDGITVGTISASMKHLEREDAPVQIATIQTLLARQRADQNYWVDAHLLLVDEVHQQATGSSAELINEYKKRGCRVCGVTATPLGVCTVCDHLIVAARTRDLQRAGILCNALWFAPSELDTRNLVRMKVDISFTEKDARRTWGPLRGDRGDVKRTKIVGNILRHYREIHPDLTHTLAFAPGVKESVWAARYFHSMGIRSLHVDGDDFWVDGTVYDRQKDPKLFDESMEAWREGHIPILWNRFVLREGIDEPQIKCILLATPIGSYRSFLQMVGRGLRTHPDKTHVTVIDYGGNWWRHGSVNVNVQWEDVFNFEDPDILSKSKIFQQRQDGEPMGQVCPQCGMVHKPFSRMKVCQYCGYTMPEYKPSRPIIQEDGTIEQVSGEPVKQYKIRETPGDRKLWESLWYNGARKGHSPAKVYQQFFFKMAERYGTKTNPALYAGYYPPITFPLMPKNKHDWWRKISMLDRSDLY